MQVAVRERPWWRRPKGAAYTAMWCLLTIGFIGFAWSLYRDEGDISAALFVGALAAMSAKYLAGELVRQQVSGGFVLTADGIVRSASQQGVGDKVDGGPPVRGVAVIEWDQVKALEWRESVERWFVPGAGHSAPRMSGKTRGVHLYARRRKGQAVQMTSHLCRTDQQRADITQQVLEAGRTGLIPSRVANRLGDAPIPLG